MDRQRIVSARLWKGLQTLYTRPEPPDPWAGGGNFPWADPEFSRRMLAEHLDQGSGAASRTAAEIQAQLPVISRWLRLKEGQRFLDLTCGPGLYAVPLAQQGLHVVGVDISPANIAYAQQLTTSASVRPNFVQGDMRHLPLTGFFAAGMILYGQFAVLPLAEAAAMLRRLAQITHPGGRLLLELLSPQRIDRTPRGSWWYSDEGGLWGDFPYLHLGERYWDAGREIASERFFILDLKHGHLYEYRLSDQMYTPKRLAEIALANGWRVQATRPAWEGLPLYDAEEWVVYILERVDMSLQSACVGTQTSAP